MPRRRPAVLPGIGLVAALALSACQGTGASEDAGNAAGDALSGNIVVSGSSTVEPITSLVAEDFAAIHPEVAYSVDGPGTGDGFALFCDGQTDISGASRAISEEEAATCATNGIEYVELQVAIDGLSVITSSANDAVDCLSFLDLYALLGPESQGFDNWSDADDLATELEAELAGEYGASHAPYPDAPLDVTAPGEESGTFDSFVEIVLEDIADARGAEATSRPDYQASGDDNVIVEGIAGSDSSLGWVGYAFAEENADAVKLLEVDGGPGCVAPTPDTIASGEYPIARPLFIYPNLQRVEDEPAIEDFVDFYLSDEGISLVDEAGYVSLDSEALAATRAAWAGR